MRLPGRDVKQALDRARNLCVEPLIRPFIARIGTVCEV